MELNKPEVRLLHNIVRERLENHTNEPEVMITMADDIAEDLFEAWKGRRRLPYEH